MNKQINKKNNRICGGCGYGGCIYFPCGDRG